MPKTHGGLWDEVVSWDNLVAAYHDARKGKRYKPDILRFNQQWEERLINIHNHLVHGSWQPQPFAEVDLLCGVSSNPRDGRIETEALANHVSEVLSFLYGPGGFCAIIVVIVLLLNRF
mgnify:CR=1 FL=1